MNTTAPFWTWFIPIAAAVIAMVGVLLNARINQANFRRQIKSAHILKRSEMRQAWIHKLRDEMASFSALVQTPGKGEEFYQSLWKSAMLIQLLMNHDDPDFVELARCLMQVMRDSTSGALAEYTIVCQRILKREWSVVKSEMMTLE